uniref:ANK_REP_REGION domain-containing protein n=1 Tax=Rhabditophanes sp. KR3021 TaxID=114890 RepID=A0AC35U6F7_9BILA
MVSVGVENMNKESLLVSRKAPSMVRTDINVEQNFEKITDELASLTIAAKSSGLSSSNKQTVPSEDVKKNSTCDQITPSAFVTLESLRSTALAKKTKTSFKFSRDSDTLFDDLLADDVTTVNKAPASVKKPIVVKKDTNTVGNEENIESQKTQRSDAVNKDDENKEEKDNKEEKCEDGPKEVELLSRGPVRPTRQPQGSTYHPYVNHATQASPQAYYGNVGVNGYNNSPVDSETFYNSYDYGAPTSYYPHNTTNLFEYNSVSSTPESCVSDTGYASESPNSNNYNSYTNRNYTIPDSSPSNQSQDSGIDNLNSSGSELPEALSDFILKYSKSYSDQTIDDQGYSRHGVNSSRSREDLRPLSADSGCESPLAAGSVPNHSPAAPNSGRSNPPTPKTINVLTEITTTSNSKSTGKSSGSSTPRTSKEDLRRLITDREMDNAWAWTYKFVHETPGAINFQDPDRDTLLHIVTFHKDLGKIYALVEQQLKTLPAKKTLPFDITNRHNETPLYLAVKKDCVEVVNYFMEADANPNVQTNRGEQDAPLHYAAGRGLTQIIQTMVRYPKTMINILNGSGLTPILCAVKHHNSIDEETHKFIDNRNAVRALLMAGANPLIHDSSNGKTVIHYAIERGDPFMIEIFCECLLEESMIKLANMADYSGERPMDLLQTVVLPQEIKQKLCLALLTCCASSVPEN